MPSSPGRRERYHADESGVGNMGDWGEDDSKEEGSDDDNYEEDESDDGIESDDDDEEEEEGEEEVHDKSVHTFIRTFHNGDYDQEFDDKLNSDRSAVVPNTRSTQASYNKPDNWVERNRIGLEKVKSEGAATILHQLACCHTLLSALWDLREDVVGIGGGFLLVLMIKTPHPFHTHRISTLYIYKVF
jgi:hypothetical protein